MEVVSQAHAANLAQPAPELARFEGMLEGRKIILSTNMPLYDSEKTNPPNQNEGQENTIVGELQIPGEGDVPLRAALVKVADAQGVRFGISGLNSEQNRITAKKTVEIKPGQVLRLGRGSQADAGEGVRAVAAEELWDRSYGGLTSRKHVEIQVTDEGLSITDTSTNGTWVHGWEVLSTPAVSAADPVEQSGRLPESTPAVHAGALVRKALPERIEPSAEEKAQEAWIDSRDAIYNTINTLVNLVSDPTNQQHIEILAGRWLDTAAKSEDRAAKLTGEVIALMAAGATANPKRIIEEIAARGVFEEGQLHLMSESQKVFDTMVNFITQLKQGHMNTSPEGMAAMDDQVAGYLSFAKDKQDPNLGLAVTAFGAGLLAGHVFDQGYYMQQTLEEVESRIQKPATPST